jgi:hypothetical protein
MTAPPRLLLANRHFAVSIDPGTGALVRLGHPDDSRQMSWVADPREQEWLPRSSAWGLGFAGDQPGIFWGRSRWDDPAELQTTATACTARYRRSAFGVTVERRLDGDLLRERLVLTHTAGREHTLGGDADGAFGIHAPFNDEYPGAAECLARRCHAHLWAHGGHAAWVCCQRMDGGDGLHLGLALTEGALAGYSIAGRDRCSSSNIRGGIILHPARSVLSPGGSTAIGWALFWHRGWDDFLDQLVGRFALPLLEADRLVAEAGGRIRLRVRGLPSGARLAVDGREQPALKTQELALAQAGEQRIELRWGDGRSTTLRALATPAPEALLAARCAFIASRQQIRDPAHPDHGALVCYDHELGSALIPPDRAAGMEKVGMGVLLAMRLQHHPDAGQAACLERFAAWVVRRLQLPDGTVLDAGGDSGSGHLRLYNFPWVALLHTELFHLDGRAGHLDRAVTTLRNFYARGGHELYAIGVPMLRLDAALAATGRLAERDELRTCWRRHAEHLRARGSDYPAHEVAYEQSIVAPAVIIMAEWALLSGDASFRPAIALALRHLEAFAGRQPHHRLHGVAIRHWDAFWFGKRHQWGDTFPHYWSGLSAVALLRCWQLTGETALRERALRIAAANLSLFRADGGATCAHVFPVTVNGEPGVGDDPLAHDQDWALVHWLLLQRDSSVP